MVQVYQEVVILLVQSLSETLSCTHPGTNYIGHKCSRSNSWHPWYLSSAKFFFQNQLFQKKISGIPSECQTVWTKIRPDILSGLIGV